MISLKGIAVLAVSFVASWLATKALIPLLQRQQKEPTVCDARA